MFGRVFSVHLRFRTLAGFILVLFATAAAAAQTPAPTPNVRRATPTPTATPNGARPTPTPAGAPSITVVLPTPTPSQKSTASPTPPKIDPKNLTAEQVAEFAVLFYGSRPVLDRIRKTTFERGTISITTAEGRVEQANYQRFVMRGESLAKEKIRLDQEFPSARYALIFSDGKIFGVYNNTVFTPREDAAKTFENQIVHGLEALLRYKENGSQVALTAREKIMGVDYYVIEVTDKEGRKTQFYVSARTFRVMMLTYEDGGVKYRRKFYDYNYAQATLVPFRSVLWANDKQVEETDVGTVTFGQKVNESLFSAS
jgi:hypothetical protein